MGPRRGRVGGTQGVKNKWEQNLDKIELCPSKILW